MTNTKTLHEHLINKLKDPKEANQYFSAILKKCKNLEKDEADNKIREALKNLAEARPEDVNIDVNEDSIKMSVLLRFLRFISRNFM